VGWYVDEMYEDGYEDGERVVVVSADGDIVPSVVPRPRRGNEREWAARRRRREAIVLNDSDRPVTQDDIIQRPVSGRGI
jgi:hypothetical protein